MTYLRKIAVEIQEEVGRDAPSDSDTTVLFDLYALLALTLGARTTPRDVHHAWVVWMLVRGEVHQSMVPYDELPRVVQAEDDPFVRAIRVVANRRQSGGMEV